MTYSGLLRSSIKDGKIVEVLEKALRTLCARAAATVEVDENWYMQTYPDVLAAMQNGTFATAREHYASDGFFEDRFPRPIEVDEKWYLNEYQDVADAIERGLVVSAQSHFSIYGFKEGRLPSKSWSL